jgi:hypothetical protein
MMRITWDNYSFHPCHGENYTLIEGLCNKKWYYVPGIQEFKEFNVPGIHASYPIGI